jgi:hypothetical protein
MKTQYHQDIELKSFPSRKSFLKALLANRKRFASPVRNEETKGFFAALCSPCEKILPVNHAIFP